MLTKAKNIYRRVNHRVMLFFDRKIEKSMASKTAQISLPEESVLRNMSNIELLAIVKVYDAQNGFLSSGKPTEVAKTYYFLQSGYVLLRDKALMVAKSFINFARRNRA